MVGQPDHPRTGRAGLPRINRRTVARHLTRLGLGQRSFIDASGHSNRKPGKIIARWPGHMAHLDVKKVGRIPDGGGWRIHGRDSAQKRAVDRAKTAGAKAGYFYLHSIVDGFSRLATPNHSTTRRARHATSIPTQDPRHQRPALIQLGCATFGTALVLVRHQHPAGSAAPARIGRGWGITHSATAARSRYRAVSRRLPAWGVRS